MESLRYTIARLTDATYAELMHQIDGGESSNWTIDSYRSGLLTDEFYGIFQASDLSGFISVQRTPDFIEITNFCIQTLLRRQGLGAQLLRFIFEKYPTSDILLEVRESNSAAKAMYASLGFAVYSVRKKYYGGTEDALLMRKNAAYIA